jgi:hypothetical protein
MPIDMLRVVQLEAHTGRKWKLELWDTGRRSFGAFGRCYLGYRLTSPEGAVLFEGDDYSPVPSLAIDSDESLRGLCGFLFLRPGDTDDEYFENYTPEQLEFARSSECEALAMYGLEDIEDPWEFVNLDGWEA